MVVAIEELCEGEPFWDSDLTWDNNTWPELTECFENTALTWIPCGYLVLIAPFYIPYLLMGTHSSRKLSLTRMFFLKVFLITLMICHHIAEVSQSAHEVLYFTDEDLYNTVWIIVMALHIAIVILEKARPAMTRFPVSFVFWLLGSLTQTVQLHSAIQRQMAESNPFRFSMLAIRYISSCFLFLLNCFSDHGDRVKMDKKDPYATASLPSIILQFWMEPLLIKGFKKPLQNKDLYNLPTKNTAANVMKKFLKIWEKEKSKCQSRKSRSDEKMHIHIDDVNRIPLKSIRGDSENRDSGDMTDDEYCDPPKASFGLALWKCLWLEVATSQVGQLGRVIDKIFSPLILGFFIDYISNKELTWHGYIYVAAILFIKGFTLCTLMPSFYEVTLCAVRVRTLIAGTIFRKSLTLSSDARKRLTTGEIVNAMSIDANNVKEYVDFSYWTWLAVVYFISGIFLTYNTAGVALFSGIGFILLMLLINLLLLHKMKVYSDTIMNIRDKRIGLMNEILNGIKVIKLYGWEHTFMKKITDIREKELKIILKKYLLEALSAFSWGGAAFWMNFVILVTFVMTDDQHYLDAKTAFVTLLYIGLVNTAINVIPTVTRDGVRARTSLHRLNRFMNQEDISPLRLKRDTSQRVAVCMDNADFAHEKNGNMILRNIVLKVEEDELIAVVGTVGSGKSSLLTAMLGEMYKLKGFSNINSTVAYVPQEAWIQNASVRENILFGSPYRSDIYKKVISNCCLEADLEIMVAGDSTEIGEKGINLSGGQKQRVSLARAVYSRANIYLLDDPLSAVDSHVGRHIFDHVIGPSGCLRGKTRILVTHGVQWLPEVDQIIVMTNGEISECGSFNELLARDGEFSKFLTQYFDQHGQLNAKIYEDKDNLDTAKDKKEILQRLVSMSSDSESVVVGEHCEPNRHLSGEFCDEDESLMDASKSSDPSQKLIQKKSKSNERMSDANQLITLEGAGGGRVPFKMYLHLSKSMGLSFVFVIIMFTSAYHVTYNFANYWVAKWNDDEHLSNLTDLPANSTGRYDLNIHYIMIYTIVGVFETVFVFGYCYLYFVRAAKACRKLHLEMLESVSKAPMRFFDTTPIGRILNRFSNDIEVIDMELFVRLHNVIEHTLKTVGMLIIIAFTLPWFLVVIIPLLLILCAVQRLYVVNSCQVRRLTSSQRSPLYSHFSETLSGTSVIRAFQAQNRFILESNSKTDNCERASVAFRGLKIWISCRLDMIMLCVLASVCLFAVLSRDELTPGSLGLAVSYAFAISSELFQAVEMIGMLESDFVSVERVKEYSVIDSEAPWNVSKDLELKCNNSLWPNVGNIEFIDFSTRYRPGLDLVVKGVSCTINGGEKVGIVGRTGAGKSSMVLSLFRLIEAVTGVIEIDGVDISQIGLHTLRHNITILPQDPVLFAGTLRMNLDPQGEKTDSEIWTALEHSHLNSFVLGLKDKLQHQVGEKGENLSMGQKQLVCLARTLLRKTKIIVLDEATAAVDVETDNLIQKTIRTEFSDCTVLTIAHRLNTILDYDRVLVFENGKLKEFDTPSSLLSDTDSTFYSMAKKSGFVGKEP